MSLLLSCPFFIYSVVVCYNMHSGYNFGEGGGEGKKADKTPSSSSNSFFFIHNLW